MTTVTEPPLIDEPSIGVDELPALEQPDERVCEVYYEECPLPAAWMATVIGPCKCGDDTKRLTFAWCDKHTIQARRLGVGCSKCGVTLALGWVEPLRSPP